MLLNFSNAKLSQLIVHFIGNKNNNESYILSDSKVKKSNKESEALLVNYFLSPFKNSECFNFWHESDIKLNPCFSFSNDIFSNPGFFIEKSKSIAKHLYECTNHPNIKSGDIFIAELTNCIYGEEVVTALVIFKSETKDTFLQSLRVGSHYDLITLSGISMNRIDKGCVIFNTSKKMGYKISIIDNLNKGSEAIYWKDDFLKITNCVDEYFSTNQILSITKNYITKQFMEEFEVTKTDQIDLLNRSIDYFKTHDAFDKKEFEKEVFYHPEMIKSFRKFDSEYRQNKEIEIDDSFDISPQAVKKQARVFKSVLKLDENFHIYIHGNKEMIEKGVEKDGRKYYKIYYENEN